MKKDLLSSLRTDSGVLINFSTFFLQPMLDPVILNTIQDVRSVEEKDLKDKVMHPQSRDCSACWSTEAQPGLGARFTYHCSLDSGHIQLTLN